MRHSRNLALLAVLGAMYIPTAFSEGPCPSGQRMVGQQGAPGAVFPICQPIPGHGSSPPQPREVWANRFGAIAFDGKAGAAGIVADQDSESKAQQMALAECAKDGAQDCKIKMSYGNQCVAVASSANRSGFARSPALQTAGTEAVAACGEPSCTVVYSACSLPVRVR